MNFEFAKKLVQIGEGKGFVGSSFNDYSGHKAMVFSPPVGVSGSNLPEVSERVEDELRSQIRSLCKSHNLKLSNLAENGQGYHVSIQDLPQEAKVDTFPSPSGFPNP